MLYRDLLYWLAGRMCVRARGAPDGIEKPQLSLELGTVRFILFTDDASADISRSRPGRVIVFSANLLCSCLNCLANYVFWKQLMVNVAKCDELCFGGGATGHGTFRYNRIAIPLHTLCKYLGVWLDADRSGQFLRN
jgi:hypothetical protein